MDQIYYAKKKIIKKLLILAIFLGIFVFSPFFAEAATLSLSPSTGIFETGERVAVKVLVTSNNVPFNAVSGILSFPSIFSVESVSKTNSALNFWVTEPTISGGSVKFEGIALGGFTGSTGNVVTINLRATKVGEGQVSFKSGQILANDGDGTDITGNLIGANYSIKEATQKAPQPKPEPIPTPEPEPVAPEIIQPAPSLKAPEIMLGAKYGSPAIIGTSEYPEAQVLMTFIAEDGVKVFILGDADVEGSFNMLVPNSLKHGLYTVTAVMIKTDKTNSQTSNEIVIKVGNIFSDIGYEIYWLILILILLILYLVARIIFHFKDKSINKNLKKELHEAEDIIHKSFDILREDEVEHKSVSEIKKDINEAEKIITKEIKDIE
ncbi:MAG: cohesin domain-containing protein [Candidatus Paceibacterota bacterium]